jgi:MazG family protein
MVPFGFSGFQRTPPHGLAEGLLKPFMAPQGHSHADFKHVLGASSSQAGAGSVNDLESFETLVKIMDRLREPGGCPWDREQDYETLRSYLIEECYEVADALDRGHPADLREELGDLLFQIVFLSRLAKEDGDFVAADVVRGIAEKMIRRHPHVFGDAKAETPAEVLRNWEQIKRQEKGLDQGAPQAGQETPSVLDGVPIALPALLKAQRLGTKASRVGFDWVRPIEVLDKIHEELGELRQAVEQENRSAVREELGDLLFSLVMLARKLDVDPEGALEQTNLKFVRRFNWIENELAKEHKRVDEEDVERLEQLWNAAKRSPDTRP